MADNDTTLRSIRIGAVVIEENGRNGNLLIFMSHRPTFALEIQNADVDDLAVALDGILAHRRSVVTPTE